LSWNQTVVNTVAVGIFNLNVELCCRGFGVAIIGIKISMSMYFNLLRIKRKTLSWFYCINHIGLYLWS